LLGGSLPGHRPLAHEELAEGNVEGDLQVVEAGAVPPETRTTESSSAPVSVSPATLSDGLTLAVYSVMVALEAAPLW